MAQELMAVMGDVQPARVPLEQFDAEVAFQFLDRLGDRGLRDRQVLGGAGDRSPVRRRRRNIAIDGA